MTDVSKQEACGKMNDNLLTQYNAIKKDIDAVSKNDVIGRHKLGSKFSEVISNQATYGDKACELLASALGVKPNYIYTHARVARVWSDAEIAAITKANSCISFSHLIHISAVPDANARKQLLADVKSYDLAVDATVKKVREIVKKTPSTDSASPQSPHKAVTKTKKMLDKLLAWQEEFESFVFDPLTDSPADYADEALLENLNNLAASFKDVEELAKGNVVKINACVAACQKIIDDESTVIDGADFETDDSMPIGDVESYDDDAETVLSVLKGK